MTGGEIEGHSKERQRRDCSENRLTRDCKRQVGTLSATCLIGDLAPRLVVIKSRHTLCAVGSGAIPIREVLRSTDKPSIRSR